MSKKRFNIVGIGEILWDVLPTGKQLGGAPVDPVGWVLDDIGPLTAVGLRCLIGAVVILADPIFQGLAISLLFGLASSTALTVLVIPAIYVVFRR